MNSRSSSWLVLLGFLFVISISPAKADTVFDQTNTGTLVELGNVLNFGPVGQSFTPTLTSLNFVDLQTAGAQCCQGGSFQPYTLELDIHSQSIFGPILGTSEPITIHPGPPLGGSKLPIPVQTPFEFSTPVTLVPGDLYVIEVFAITGEALVGSTGNNYPGGTMIANGVVQPNTDLWFQEGIVTAEPNTLLLLGAGLVGLFVTILFRNCLV